MNLKDTSMQNKMRIVFDTNVYISAFNWREGNIQKIYRAAIGGHFILLISPAIISEIAGKLRSKFFWGEDEIRLQLKELIKKSHIVQPKNFICVLNDEPDNRVLECAVEGQADLIVSGDLHLLNLKIYENIPIIRPADFFHTIQEYID